MMSFKSTRTETTTNQVIGQVQALPITADDPPARPFRILFRVRWACVVFAALLSLVPVSSVVADDNALRDAIDRELTTAWEKEQLATPALSTDAVFLRRIYLDLVGMVPTYEETTAFLSDPDPQKREKLIDKLLADPRYARNQAQVWDVNLLGRNPEKLGHQNPPVAKK